MKSGIAKWRGGVLAGRVWITETHPERARGLLGRDGLPAGEAMLIVPCKSIHMFGMRFAIDVVFLSRDDAVLGIRRHVKPWRIALAPRGTVATLEMPSGAAPSDLVPGDRIEIG